MPALICSGAMRSVEIVRERGWDRRALEATFMVLEENTWGGGGWVGKVTLEAERYTVWIQYYYSEILLPLYVGLEGLVGKC